MEPYIHRRILALQAEANLKSILETYVGELQQFDIMNERICEFLEWLWNESPIA